MSIHVYVYFINLLCHTGVIRQIYQNFYAGILEGQLAWTGITPEVGSNITERYSHCACYYDKSMYIFGGCTSTNTTFNDLWRFDLKDRQWIRPLAIGSAYQTIDPRVSSAINSMPYMCYIFWQIWLFCSFNNWILFSVMYDW